MDPRLRNTPIERIQELFAYVLVHGLCEKDARWVNSPDFLRVAEYAGLQGDTPQRIRDLFNCDRIDFQRLRGWVGAESTSAL